MSMSSVRSLGQTSLCLTAFAAGQAIAYKIFEVINRNPEIDVYDTKGMVNRTIVVVAHQLSTIRNADMIAVVQHGSIVEKGQLVDSFGMNGGVHEVFMDQVVKVCLRFMHVGFVAGIASFLGITSMKKWHEYPQWKPKDWSMILDNPDPKCVDLLYVNYHREALTRGAVFMIQESIENEIQEKKVIAAHTKDDLWVRRLYECVGFLTFSSVHSVVHSGGSTLVKHKIEVSCRSARLYRFSFDVNVCVGLCSCYAIINGAGILDMCIYAARHDPKMSIGAEEIVEGCSNCNGHKKMMNPQSSKKGKMNSEIGLVQNGYAMKIEDLETGNMKGCCHCYEMPNFESFKCYKELSVTPTFLQKIAAEIISTFILVFVTCGSSIMVHDSHPLVSQLRGSIASCLVVTVMIYSVGHIFGPHMKPAVTITFATIRHFPWTQVLGYIGAQSVGALSASFTLRLMFESVSNIGILLPLIGELAGIVVGSIVMMSSIFAE
eukprot:Gb_36753 [translate_table: standard]